MNTFLKSKTILLAIAAIVCVANITQSQTFVPFKQRLQNGGVNLKGDITFIANSIVSKNQDGTVPNDDYNGSEGNNRLNLDYIDVDNDATTFSSSKAQLNLPSCSKVVFAGLYWSAVYPRKFWNDTNSTRDADVNTIKFKLPNQSYQDVTGEVIFDGLTLPSDNEKVVYTCFKDVTDIVEAQNDPNGDYFAANIKATVRGRSNTGSSAGWILVVIYENETEPTRRVSIFDGFTAVKGGSNSVNAEVSYSGFKTIPTGPVRAKLLVAALEGDRSITGDRFQFKDVNGTFQTLSTPNTNPASNFFNGSITINDQYLPNRNPSSQNTLGFDADLFNLNNINNNLLANNQTDADIRLITSGDGYWVFLNAMSVEIIEPDIELIKTIEDVNGNDIAGADVTLGNEIWYNISFKNKGNDDATLTQIVDRLPKNVDLFENEIIVPAGVTYTYQQPTLANEFRGELVFTIPDNLVELGDPTYNIRLKVKVVESCNELRDVCSNIIQNQAFVDYTGKINGVTITNTPSFFGVDNCNRGFEGPSNFLVDVDQCTYERDEVLCTDSVELTAGAGFLSYTWKDSAGNVIGNTQTITVTQTGRYTVDKVAPVGCISSQEVINVVSFITQTNPIIDFADEVKTCPDDGSLLSEIYLCGTESSKLIETNIFNSNTIIWQKLDENSCTDNDDENCPNTNNSCTWNTIKTGNDFVANEAGRFRVEIRAQGGCFKRYYFDVFQASLNPLVDKTDIICGTSGNITINNISDDYQFSLTNDINTFQDNNSFEITTAGSYTVYIRKKGGSATSCVYELPIIDVFEKNIEVDLIVEPIQCAADNGAIRVQVNNVDGDYIYQLLKDGNLLVETAPKADNDHTFQVSEAGVYTVKVTAPNNCSFEGTVEITKPEPINFSAVATKDISCTNGIIDFNTSGGTPIYNYAIWSYNGVEKYASVNTIPIIEFFTDSSLEITPGNEGTYEFVVVDNNNCFVISNPVTINLEPPFTFSETVQNVTCNGDANGSFTITPNEATNNYTFTYSIDNGVTYQSENLFSNLAAGTYTVLINANKNSDTCPYQKTVVISEPSALSANAILSQDYTCDVEGTITFDSVSGGTAPYTYSLDGINFLTSNIFNNLQEGTYKPVVKDANNCTLQLADIIINPLPIAPNFTSNIIYNCDGTGNVEILPTDASYTYSLNGGAFVTTNTFSNLAEGNHVVRINIGKNCIETVSFNVLPNQAFSGFVSTTTDAICFGDANGSIKINVENFGSDYQYSLNNGTWITANTSELVINNLTAGTYNIRIQSSTCVLDLGDAIISQPSAIAVTAAVSSEISCTNSGATISASATGGTPPYLFSVDNGITWVSNLTNIAAGNYTVMAKDQNNCTSVTNANITVDSPKTIAFSTSVTNCFNGNNGEINITVTDGNGGYVFSLNDGPWQSPNIATPNSFTFANLQPNTYKIAIKDNLSCEVTEENLVINPQLNASVTTTDISCNDGSITVTASGGDGNYVYAFVAAGTPISNGDFSTTNTTSITTSGNYDVYVRDKSGAINYCEFTQTVTVNKLPDLDVVANATQPKCFDEAGSLALTFSGGKLPYAVTVTNTLGFTETTPSIFSTTKEYFNLVADTYTITITDANNCSKQITSDIVNPTDLLATITPILPDCDETDVNQFGIDFSFNPADYNPYIVEFSIDNGNNWSTNTNYMGIASGTIIKPMMRLLETNGTTLRCIKSLDDFRMPFNVTNLIVNTTATGNCADGFSVTVEASEGIAPYEFAINSPTNWLSSGTDTYSFTNLIPGLNYTFYVKDANGCIKENSEDVYDTYIPDVEILSTVTSDACATTDNGEITFSINDTTSILSGTINWILYDADTDTQVTSGSQNNTNDIVVSNLPSGNFYIVITNNACSWGSKDVTINRGLPIIGTPIVAREITCNLPGIITINSLSGGFGNYQFTLTSTNFVNPIVSSNTSIEIGIDNLVDATTSSTVNVTVIDGSSCAKDLGNVVINVSQKPEIQTVVTDVCDVSKSLTITATNGQAPYFYSIDNGATYQSNATFTNVAEGNYTVSVIDSNGCVSLSEAVIVHPSLTFEASITKNLDCSVNPEANVEINLLTSSNDVDIEVKNALNATVISRRTFNNPSETIQFSNTGVYTITLFDNVTNCTESLSIEILEKEEPTFTYQVENSLCFGSNTGIIKLNNTNAAVNYTYSILPNAGTFDASSNQFVNVPPGTYQITATANNACTSTQMNVVIDEFDAIQIPSAIVTDFSCTTGNTSSTASIAIDVSNITGGSGNYTLFEFINNQGTADVSDDVVVQLGSNSTYNLNDLNGGNFTINVYDDKGCSAAISAVVNPFNALTTVSVTTNKLADCNTGASIQIDTNTEVSAANKSYLVTSSNGFSETNTSGLFTNLTAGFYTIRVTNLDTNCFLETNYEVEEPNDFELIVEKESDNNCLNGSTGSISFDFATSTVYSDSYSYVLMNNTNNQPTTISGSGNGKTTVSSIPPGEYYVAVTQLDFPFCVVNSNPFSIEAPPSALDFTYTTTPVTCASTNSATLLVNAFGGWQNYQYKLALTSGTIIQDFGNNNSFTNLAAGEYVISVTDQLGCLVEKSVVFTNPTEINATISATPLVCFDDTNASISINSVSGGQGNPVVYYYQLQKESGAISTKQTANTFNNLTAGNYTVIISDEYSCSKSYNIAIDNPSTVNVSAAITSTISCAVNTATVSVTASGGSGNYTYSQDGSTFTTSNTFNVVAGTHQFYAKDDNGCVSEASAIVEIEDVVPLTATLDTSASLISCAGESNAVLKAIASGGFGNYEYELLDENDASLRPRQTDDTFSDLSPGTYKVRVYSKDCIYTTQPYQIVEPDALVFSAPVQATDISCFGSVDGSIVINAQGGTGKLLYSIDQVKYQESNTFLNLTAGTYDVVVQDERGCFISETVTIEEPSQLSAQAINIQQELCVGDKNGSFSLDITGGTAPYKTSFNAAPFVENQLTFSNLEGGKTYVIFIEDAKGCDTFLVVSLESPVALNLTSTTTLNCTNYLSTVQAIVDDSIKDDVLFSLNNGTPQASNIFENLASGTYTLTATHSNGCSVSEQVVINNPAPLTIEGVTASDVLCFGGSTGSITVTASGGQGNLLYSIDGTNFQTSNVFTNLAKGTYQVTVKDEANCSRLSAQTIVNEPNQLTVSANITNQESCVNENDGAFELTISGGTAPYRTSLDNAAFVENQLTFSNLEGGKTYQVAIQDANGCSTSVQVTFDNAIVLALSSTTTLNCTNYLSTVQAIVDDSIKDDVLFSLNNGTPQASNIFENLASGTYTLTATHSNGCSVSEQVVINNPAPLTIEGVTASDVLCFGGSTGSITVTASGGQGNLLYSIDGTNFQTSNVFTNLAKGTYQVTVKDETNCQKISQQTAVNQSDEIVVSLKTIQQEICLGDDKGSFEIDVRGGNAPYAVKLDNGNYVENQFAFSNLDGGKTYVVSVKDANNCETNFTVALESPINLNLELQPEYNCANDATIFAIVDDVYEGKVTYTINGNNPQRDGIFTNISKGEYIIEATHDNGCSVRKSVVIEENPILELTVDKSKENHLISIASGGVPPYLYSIDGGDYGSENEFLISETRFYTLSVKDSRGCIVNLSTEGEYIDIVIPNFFTPNGNGKHDTWYPTKVKDYHNIEVQIYDRYSRLLKTFRGVNNAWDGNYNNRPLPSGDYWYVIYYDQTPLKRRKLMGHFTLYR